MLNLKKTAVAVLAFGSSAVFAGTMGPVCTPGSVTVPCEHSAWDFAGQALYLQPTYSGAPYWGSTTTGTVQRFNKQNYNWGWGFKLEGSYHFSTGNDIDLNWYHWNNSSSATLPSGITTRFGSVLTGTVRGYTQPKWDAVNLEFGQHVDFGEFDKIRFHGDIAYVRLQTSTSFSASGATVGGAAVTTAVNTAHNSTYNGVGPRVGADMSYGWGNGFNIYANAAGALFAGTSSFNRSATATLGGTTYVSGSSTQVVPEIEAKLGATYTYAMAQGDLSLDAGWMWINYFSAQQVNLTAGTATGSSNVAFQGPYIGLKWVGNVV